MKYSLGPLHHAFYSIVSFALEIAEKVEGMYKFLENDARRERYVTASKIKVLSAEFAIM